MWQLRLSYSYWRHRLGWLVGSSLSVAVTVGLAFVVTHLWLETKHAYTHFVEKPLGTAEGHIIATDEEGMFAVWQNVLETMPDLEVVTPVLSRQTVVRYEDNNLSVQVRGVDPETDALIHPVSLLEGRMIANDDKTSALVSSTLAKQLGLGVNETLELVTPQGVRSYTVIGIAAEVSSGVALPLRDMQKLFTSGQHVDGFDVRFTPTTNQTLALQHLRERLKNVATVLTSKERVQSVRYVFGVIQLVLLTVFAFTVVMILCLLWGLLETSKSERQDESKTLYMLGVSVQLLSRWRRLELSTVLITASFLGILVAAVFVPHQISYIPFLTTLLFALVVVVVGLFFFDLGLATNSSLSNKKPFIHRLHRFIRFKTFNLCNLRMSNVLWLQTLPSNLWLTRQLLAHLGKRYWLAVFSFTLALTGFTSLGILLQMQRQSLESFTKQPVLTERTLQIQEEFPASLSSSTRWNMAMMPGVVFVSSYLTKVTMEEKFEEDMYVLDVGAFPYQSYLQTSDGVKSDALAEALKTDRHLALSESLAKSYGLKVGMGLRLRTATGSQRYKIVATLKDIGGVSRAMFISRESYLRDWGRDGEGLFVLSFEETLQVQQVEGLLREQLARSPGLPWTMVSFKSDLERQLGEMLAWCRWLMLLFVVVAVSALGHALSSPALGNLLATLYLLGGQRRLLNQQTQKTVLLTTVLVTLLALALATTLSYVLVDGLKQSGSYWSWQLSGSSYSPSLAIFLSLVSFLTVMINKTIRSR